MLSKSTSPSAARWSACVGCARRYPLAGDGHRRQNDRERRGGQLPARSGPRRPSRGPTWPRRRRGSGPEKASGRGRSSSAPGGSISAWAESSASQAKTFAPDDLSDDLTKHAGNFGISSDDSDAFVQQAQEIIRNADEYAANFHAEEAQLAFWKDGRDVVIVDRDLRIRGCYRNTHPVANRNIREGMIWLQTKGSNSEKP